MGNNTNTEASLREVLKLAVNVLKHVLVFIPQDPFIELTIKKIEAALSPDPHASDCDKQGATKSEGAGLPSEILDACSPPSGALSHSVPSDRTADVTCDALASFIAAKAQVDFGGWETDLARALLDAYKVGRR